MAYNDGGQICLDKNGAVFVRYGENILKCTAMCEWDGMLVMGTAGGNASTVPNLVFLKKSAYKEKCIIHEGTCTNVNIKAVWTSPNYHAADYACKKITRLEITYKDYHGYVHHATDSGFSIYYRRDHEVDVSQQSSKTENYLPKWTLLKYVPLPAGTNNANYDHEHTVVYDLELECEARNWQFRITSTAVDEEEYQFEVIGFTVWVGSEQLTQD
jgi:hypothetical protein